jgi:hypothetical protein
MPQAPRVTCGRAQPNSTPGAPAGTSANRPG